MTKRKNNSDSKIVAFPGLCRRLIEKGLLHLEQRDYEQAAELFSQAYELEPDNPELNIGLIVSLVELNRYLEAKELCRELLQKGIGDYFQVINIYLMVLLHLNEHEEMISTIEALFDEGQVPPDRKTDFENMLQFSKRALEEDQDWAEEEPDLELKPMDVEELFKGSPEADQLAVISRLSRANIRQFIPAVTNALKEEELSPFMKTLLLNILREQEFEQEVLVTKFSKSMAVVPSKLAAPHETEFFLRAAGELQRCLQDQEPALFEMAKGLMERQQMLLYPFNPDQEEYREYAAAYHLLAEEYLKGAVSLKTTSFAYNADPDETAKKMDVLRKIEEFSYPLI